MTARRFGAVLLDRDGTLNVKAPPGRYITAADELCLLPGAARAVRRLNRAGLPVVVVTNQRAIHRGLMSRADLDDVHRRLRGLLAERSAFIGPIYACPHGLDGCACRKPRPGLLLRAARDDARISLAAAVTIGDTEDDVAAGIAAGTATVRLGRPTGPSAADAVVPDLARAVDWVLGAPMP